MTPVNYGRSLKSLGLQQHSGVVQGTRTIRLKIYFKPILGDREDVCVS